MLTKKLHWWRSESDWLSLRVNKWIAYCQGYTKIHSKKLSCSCQTMFDHPQQQKPLTWSCSDTELLEEFSQQHQHQQQFINEEEQERLECPGVSNEKSLQTLLDNKEIEEYLEYLNKPIITMSDHYIEVHQYHYEPEMVQKILPHLQAEYRSSSRSKHYINDSRTEIVEAKGLAPISTEYSELLIKKNLEHNHSIEIVSDDNVNKEENKYYYQGGNNILDKHRALLQILNEKHDTIENEDNQLNINRRQIFTRKTKNESDENSAFTSFPNLRGSKKNKSGRRKKKVIVGESGLNGPIWPEVLLTFDRAVSPTPGTKNVEPDESFV